MVYAREVDGRKLTFIVSGKLWRNSLIMQDLETGTLWSLVSGLALEGPLVGTQLEILGSVQTDWASWSGMHPEGRVLRKDREVLSSRYESYFSDPERTGIFRAHYLMDQLPGKTVVLGIRSGPHALAVTDSLMTADGLIVDAVDGEPVTFHLAADGGVRAWRAALKRGGEPGLLVASNGEVFSALTGTSEKGGESLKEIPVHRAYWFAWSAFHPNTDLRSGN